MSLIKIATKIAVVGAGGWGTTLANVIAVNGHAVHLWVREPELKEEIGKKRQNSSYLPGVILSENIVPSSDLEGVVRDAAIIVMAVPSKFVREMAAKIKPLITKEKAIVVSAAKGLENETYKTMSQVLEEELPQHIRVIAISGPNHCEEVSRRMPTATVIASKDKKALEKVKGILNNDYFKVYPLDDRIGVEVCGAIKNITAIAAGVVDGLNYGDNTRASIITLGLTEMSRFGKAVGAKRATFYGLAGVGDLIATATSKHSRNHFVGEKIAEGMGMEDIQKEMHGMVAEGVYTVKSVYEFSVKNSIDMPLTTQVYKVLYEGKNLRDAISDLIKLI